MEEQLHTGRTNIPSGDDCMVQSNQMLKFSYPLGSIQLPFDYIANVCHFSSRSEVAHMVSKPMQYN